MSRIFSKAEKLKILKESFKFSGCCTKCGCKLSYPPRISEENELYNYIDNNSVRTKQVYPKPNSFKVKLRHSDVLCRECDKKRKKTKNFNGYHSNNNNDCFDCCIVQ